MKEKIKQIKYFRLKEEEKFLIEMINDIEPFVSNKFPKSIFWVKKDVVLLEQDFENNYLHVNSELIWDILFRVYNLLYTETQVLITNVIKNNTQLDPTFYPHSYGNKKILRVNKYLQLEPLIYDKREN